MHSGSRIQTAGSGSLLQNVHCPEYAGDNIMSEGNQYTGDTNLESGTSAGGRSARSRARARKLLIPIRVSSSH